MSKKNIFIVIFFALITVASFATADYIDPSSSAPNNNTPIVLKTESENSNNKDFTYEKIGTGNGNLYPALTQLTNGSYFGVTDNGQAYGLFSDKSVVVGNTIISDDFTVSSRNTSDPFDQYTNQFSYLSFPGNTSTTAKKLEALINGIFFSKVLISDNGNDSDPAAYSLELRPSSATPSPTTNIGLGNTCKLYTLDLGSTIGAFDTGCPEGSYMSMYKGPSLSGTLSSGNNTNNQVVAQCTYFKPSASPTNNTDCYTPGISQASNNLAFHGGDIVGYYSITQISPGNCKLKARISANQLKDPTITIKESSSPNIIFGTTSTTYVDNLSVSCTQPTPDFVIMDGYNQYYTNLKSAGWNDPEWNYVW